MLLVEEGWLSRFLSAPGMSLHLDLATVMLIMSALAAAAGPPNLPRGF